MKSRRLKAFAAIPACLLSLPALFFSCRLLLSMPDIYMGGYYTDASNHPIPCYWRNGEKHDLPGIVTGGAANTTLGAFSFSGGRCFIAGSTYDGLNNLPCYWVNTQRIDLPYLGTAGFVNDMDLYRSDLFCAGTNGAGIAVVWRNGSLTRIDTSTTANATYATGIQVVNSDVYVAGQFQPNPPAPIIACYWVNNTRIDLDSVGSPASQGHKILVKDGNIYVCGYHTVGAVHVPCLWVNGTRTDLANDGTNGDAKSVFVDDNNTVYVAGMIGNDSRPCVWVNDARSYLDISGSTQGNANTIFVRTGDVYVAGNYLSGGQQIPCYWRNGRRVDLSREGTGMDAEAKGICLN